MCDDACDGDAAAPADDAFAPEPHTHGVSVQPVSKQKLRSASKSSGQQAEAQVSKQKLVPTCECIGRVFLLQQAHGMNRTVMWESVQERSG